MDGSSEDMPAVEPAEKAAASAAFIYVITEDGHPPFFKGEIVEDAALIEQHDLANAHRWANRLPASALDAPKEA